MRSHSREMAFARELPMHSEFAVPGSALIAEDDPANRVLFARGPSVP